MNGILPDPESFQQLSIAELREGHRGHRGASRGIEGHRARDKGRGVMHEGHMEGHEQKLTCSDTTTHIGRENQGQKGCKDGII